MLNVPMIPFAALDSNSLMNQLGSPRVIGCYDSNNIMNMPSAYSRPMMGSMGSMGGVGGMNMNSAMGLVGAAGLGFAAASMMNSNGGGMSGIADSFGITDPNRPSQQNNYSQPNAYNQPAQPNAYGQPNAYNQPSQPAPGRPISQNYGQPVQQNYSPASPQYGFPTPQNNYIPSQNGLTNTAYNTGSDMTAVFNNTAGNIQPAFSSVGNPNAMSSFNPNPVQQSAYNPNAMSSFNPNPVQQSAYNPNAATSFNPNPVQQSAYNPNAATSFNPNPVQQPAAPKPKINRRRAPAEGKAVIKGQKFALETPGEPPLNRVKFCLGWETADDRCELDASAFMLCANEKVLSDDYFIFYGQPTSPDRSVNYKVFDNDPNNCDDAAVEIDLAGVDPRVGKIAVAITIYEAFERRLNFGMVPMVYARIVNSATGKEIARFELTERNSAVTALVVGELYRYKGSWKFNAVGSGVNRDLAGFCGMYGVNLE